MCCESWREGGGGGQAGPALGGALPAHGSARAHARQGGDAIGPAGPDPPAETPFAGGGGATAAVLSGRGPAGAARRGAGGRAGGGQEGDKEERVGRLTEQLMQELVQQQQEARSQQEDEAAVQQGGCVAVLHSGLCQHCAVLCCAVLCCAASICFCSQHGATGTVCRLRSLCTLPAV